jgi:hypothetical protein
MDDKGYSGSAERGNFRVLIRESHSFFKKIIMENHKIFSMPFAKVYPMYIQKAERKGRTKAEVDTLIFWLTGYDEASLQQVLDEQTDFRNFFGSAPRMHPNAHKISGVICGCKIENIEDPLMKQIRYLDKLIDELAKGKAMEKILRT